MTYCEYLDECPECAGMCEDAEGNACTNCGNEGVVPCGEEVFKENLCEKHYTLEKQ